MKIILDTMPLIGYFKGEEGYERVRDLIRKIEVGDIDGFISAITVIESITYILEKLERRLR